LFCLETERSISNDWVVRYENRYFQLQRTSDYPPRQAKVTVCEWEDGRIEIRYKSKARPHREIDSPRPAEGAIRLLDKPPRQGTFLKWVDRRERPMLRAARVGITLTGRSITMQITSKGQVTIPQEIRNRLGLLPHTKVEFELAGDHARIRKARRPAGESARGRLALEVLRGTADTRMSTDEILALARGGIPATPPK